MKIFIKTKKFISVITALCLLISFVIGPTATNAMTNEEATVKYKQIFKDFMLPYNYGQITSAHYAGTDRVIINIQDLHCHPKVQKNISNIIEIFDKSFGVKNVYLEGVYEQLSTKWLSDRIEPAKKNEILEKMLDTGRLTGAEYYSVVSGKTEIITGLEEKGPYLENLKRFGEIVDNQEKINLILNAMNESLLKVKKQYYTKRQYKLEELSKKYREGTISPQKYYVLLLKHTDKLGIDLSKYENTFTYMTLLEMQKTLDYSKITNELQNLILLLRENLANSAYQMLVDNTENFSKIDKLYGYIVRISRELGLDLTVNFPNLDNYFGYIEFSQKINPLELIVEEKKLTEEINTRFSETKAQREVVFLTNFEKYLKDYVSSKITSDDYEYYKENIDTFRQLWNKYVDNKVLSLLDEYIAEADKFYKINTDRNIYFTDNMFTEESVLGRIENEVEAKGDVNKIIDNMKGVKEVDVVITGGFHSQTVTEILKNHGVSYIVITPNVTDGVKLAEETYYEIAKEQSKISFQTLATLPFSAYPENIRVRAAVSAFGVDIAKELFPNSVAQIDTITLDKDQEETAKAIAEQMKNLKKAIEESKFLESDDDNFVEFLNKISGEKVGVDLAKFVDLDELKEILTDISINDRAAAIKNVLKNAERDMNSGKTGRTVRKAITKIRRTFLKTTDKFRSQEGYLQKQRLIDQIRTLPKLSEPHKKLLMSRDDKHKRILEELSKYDYDKLEKYGQEYLQHYLELTKQLWNIKEITSPDQVRREIEESFAKVEMFFTLIGYSAPQGNYEEITMSVLAPLMEKISKELGKERFGILSSPTASQGSIDAASTVLSQMYDALMVYITAKSYLGYVEPEKFPGAGNFKKIEDFLVNMDKADLMKNGTNLREFLNAFKFVAENGDIYSKAVAQTKNVPNFAIIIGGRAVSIENDLINAYEEGNEIFLINSRLLAAQSPAITETRAINNSVEYLLFLVDLIEKGIIKGITDDKVDFDDDKITVLNPKEKELYDLLRANELSSKIKKFIEILFKKGVKNRDDLGKLKIHVMDLDDADIDMSAGEKKVKEQLKEKGKKLAEKIFEIIENFIKPALTADDLEWGGSVKSAEVEVQAFDLEYAKSHGYLEGVEEAEAKYDEDGYRYYVLKSEYDKGRHVTARIYDADPDNSTLSARTNVSVNPMFVVSEKGSVSFMGREKFERIYRPHVSKDKTVGQIFDATKREVEVEVSFAEPMSIIETDEGRDTILPYYIVVKGTGKPYAMSIAEFMRIYPQNKNPEFYKQHEEEIKRLQDAQNIRSAEKAEVAEQQVSQEQVSVEQPKEQKGTTTQEQQEQKGKKGRIKAIIAGILVTGALFLSTIIPGYFQSAKSESTVTQEAITQEEQASTEIQYSTPNMEQILSSHEAFEQLYNSFKRNNTMFAPESKGYLETSLTTSSSKEVRDFLRSDIGKALSFLNLPSDYDNVPEVIFMKTDSNDEYFLGSACAHTVEINGQRKDFIIIPVNYNKDGTFNLDRQVLSTIVHEWTHHINRDKVERKEMSRLQDEYEATRNGYLMLEQTDSSFSFYVDGNLYVMPFDQGIRVFGFSKILEEQDRVTEFFKKFRSDVSFNDLYYGDVISNVKSEDGKNLVMIEIFDTESDKRGVFAVIDEDGNLTIQEYVKIENVYEDGSQEEIQFEATKDGKKTRVKAKKSSKIEAKQTDRTPDRTRWEELYDIFQRAPLSSNRVNKSAIIGSFVHIARDLNVSDENLNKILLPLAKELSEKRIDDISTEANCLTFKILLSKYFQGNKRTKTRMTDYEDAMKIGRLLYYTIGDKAADLTEQQIDKILPLLMDIYYKGVEQLQSRNTVTNETGFYCLLGMEEECTNEGWESIFKLLGINPKRDYFKCTGDYSDDKVTIYGWLDTIRFYPENKARYGLKNMYAMYSGHGQPTHLSTGEHNLKVEDIVEALVDARRKGADLSEITLDLATCWSYFSSINIIEQLKKRLEEENLPLSFPNIVTDAGYESLKGKFIDMKNSPVSIDPSYFVSGKSNVTLSNKEVSLIEYILAHKFELEGRKEKGLTLADFHNAERASANYTVFAVTNEEMENLFDDLRQNVFEILGLSSDEITYGTKDMEITEYLDIYEEHERTVLVQRWLAKKGNMIYMELLLAKTKAILDRIGNTKIIKTLYKDKAGENFKNTRFGKAIGVNLETFAFWMPKFVAAHNFRYASQDSGARAVVWRIRSLSIGIGMVFGVLSAIINLINPITATIAIPAIITTLVATALTANTFHYFYDIGVYNGIDPSELENMINDIDREQAIRNAKLEEIQPGFGQLIEQKSRIITISDFFREKGFVGSAKELDDSDGIALGLLSHELMKDENNEGIFVKLISAICRTTNIADWQIALRYFADRKPEWGLVGVTSDKYMPELVEYCKRTNKKIYFFLPNETKEYSRTRGQAKVDPRIANNESSRTRNELKWLKDHPEALPYVEFVVGAYDFLDVESVEEYNKYFSDDKKTTDTVSAMLRTPELFGEQTQSQQEQEEIKKGFFGRFFSKLFSSRKSKTSDVLAELNLENKDKYYDADKDKLEQQFLVNVGDNTYIFTLNIGYNSDVYFTLDYMNGEIVDMAEMDKVQDYLGIDFDVSADNKTLYIIKTNNFNEGTQIYPLNDNWDIPFQNMDKTASVEFGENIDLSDAEKRAIEKDTGTVGSTYIYLDDYIDNTSALQAKIKQASDKNELIIIHFFRNNNFKNSLTYKQILSKYKQIQSLVGLFSFYGKGSEFLIAEILKNAFVHGNQCKFEEPIAFYIKVNADGSKINRLAVYNKKSEGKENIQLKTLAVAASLSGFHMGVKRMTENKNYDYVAGDISLGENLGKNNFYKASAEFHISKEENIEEQGDITSQHPTQQLGQEQQQVTQQGLSETEKTKIISDIIDDICRDVEREYKITNLSLPEELNTVIQKIIESIEKEDKISFLQRDRIKRLIIDEKQAYLSPIYDFAAKQKHLKEQLEWLSPDIETFIRIFNETVKKLQVSEGIKTDLSDMKDVAKNFNTDSDVYDLIDFLINNRYKTYEVEQIFRNLGLIQQSRRDEIQAILDESAKQKIEEGIESKIQAAKQQGQGEEREFKSIVELEREGIHPIENIIRWAMGLLGQIFGNNIKLEGKIIMAKEGLDIKAPDDITKVTYRIESEKSDIMLGTVIGVVDGRTIRVKKQGNNIIFYSKAEEGLTGISEEQIKSLFMEAFSSGIRAGSVKIGSAIAFARAGDNVADIQNRIANAAIDGMQRAEIEVSLDLSDTENIGNSLKQKCEGVKGQSTTIVINAKQLSKYGSEINGLRTAGFRFILRGKISEIEDAFEKSGTFSNSNFNLDGAILDGEGKNVKESMNKLEELAANNTEGTLHIETQMYVDMATAKGLDANRIYDDNGIIPIVTMDQATNMVGKYAIGYSEIENSNIEKMLSGGKVVNILCADGKEDQLEKLRQRLAGIFKNMFGTMNELLKPKSPEQRVTEETNAVSDYNFGEEFGKEIENVREKLLGDLREGGIIKRILTERNVIDKDVVEELLIEFKKSEVYTQLPSVIKMRIQTEMEGWKSFEAIGTIRGFVNQVIDSAILEQWRNSYENLTLEKQHEKYSELRNKYLGKEYKEYREYARIIIIQLLMSNEKLNLDSLIKMRPDTNQRVEDLFNEIKTSLNKDVIKSIIENKTAIKEITSNDEGNTIENLGNILALLEGNLIKASAVEKLEIPVTAVRSILAAA